MPRNSVRRDHGFSMLELLVVVAIIITLTAIAVPTAMNVVESTRMRGAMGDVSGLFQNGRGMAVRQNTITRLRFDLVNNRSVAYIDNGVNPTGRTVSTPQVWMPPQFTKVGPPSGGSPPLLDDTKCGASNDYSLDTADDTYFNQLGSPCKYNSGTCTTTTPFAYYFNYAGGSGTAWAAMCISPAGRMKAWYWNGSGWSN